MSSGVIEAALGTDFQRLAPAVQAHFRRADELRYAGTARCFRRRDWVGRILPPVLDSLARRNLLFPESGTAHFELAHETGTLEDGRASLSWLRTFHIGGHARSFQAVMTYDAARGCIVDWLGGGGHLMTELHAAATPEGALEIRSGRQWLNIAGLQIPLPGWLKGDAAAYERDAGNGRLGMHVIVSNPMLGPFFGYEREFAPVNPTPAAEPGRSRTGS